MPSQSAHTLLRGAKLFAASTQVYPGAMPGRRGDAAVSGHQHRIQRLCKRDVSGVVGREVMPQCPDPLQQDVVRVATQRKILKSIDGAAATSGLDLAGSGVAPQHLGYLDVDQMGRMQRKSLLEQPLLDGGSCRGLQQCFEKRRRVDHDHSASRSARTASSGVMRGFVGERCASR